MEHESGTVIKIENDTIIVKMEMSEQCRSCGAKHCCISLDNDNTRHMELRTSTKVNVGDKVTIGYEPGSRIISAFLVFIVPILFLIAGYSMGIIWLGSEGKAILAAFGGLIVSFFTVRFVSRILERHQSFIPVIVDVQSQ